MELIKWRVGLKVKSDVGRTDRGGRDSVGGVQPVVVRVERRVGRAGGGRGRCVKQVSRVSDRVEHYVV